MSPTNLPASMQTGKLGAAAGTVVLAAMAYFAVIIVALHFLRPDLSPVSLPTSYYAIGPYGFLMSSAFLSMSVATWAMLLGLDRTVAEQAQSRAGHALLGLWGIGVLVAMIFPLDLEGAPQTLSGTIHQINGRLAFLSLTLGMILVSRRLTDDERWRRVHRGALTLSLAMLVMIVVTILNMATGAEFGGLAQRISLALIVTWYVLMASRLRSISSAPFGPDDAAGG